ELYLGRFRLELIAPYPQVPEDVAATGEDFLTRLRSFLDGVDGTQIEQDAKIPDEVLSGMAEIGAFGMKIPEGFGGLGLGQVYYNRALALIGGASPALGALVSAHQSIGVPEPLQQFGTREQQERYLPRCASGAISAFLLTEPDVGSDPARLQLAANPTPEGDYLLE